MPDADSRPEAATRPAPDTEPDAPATDEATPTPRGCRTDPETPARGRHRKALLEPAVLLSLLPQDVHGYELIERVQDLVGDEVCVDPGSTYRMLRTMERDGLVASTWVITEQGPNRRTYAITQVGREALERAVAELRRRARTLEDLAAEAEERLRLSVDEDRPPGAQTPSDARTPDGTH